MIMWIRVVRKIMWLRAVRKIMLIGVFKSGLRESEEMAMNNFGYLHVQVPVCSTWKILDIIVISG